MWKLGTVLYLAVVTLAVVGVDAKSARGQAYGPFLEVTKTDDVFTVEAEGATLPQVLSAIGEKAGFSVQDTSGGANRQPIPVFEVRDASLESTLRQLLGTSNHLIVYRGGNAGRIADGSVEKIVLLSESERERVSGSGTSSLAGPPGTQAAPAPRRQARSSYRSASDDGNDPDPAAGADPQQQRQLEYGDSLQEMEHQMIEQMGVDPTDVAGGAPGVPPPGLPPDVLQRLQEYAGRGDLPPDAQRRLEEFANGGGAMPPPDVISPPD